MYERTAAAVALASVLSLGTAFSQTPAQAPNPTQRGVDTAPEANPIFRVTVVARTTTAINYRPRSGSTKIDFVGTPLLPAARGDATVKGERGYISVDANFEKLEPATKFGPEYLTYVLWAITPEGRATNLGELQVSGDDGELDVTTELQAFGLIVTAEPYFAVTQPSDVVVMENVIRDNTVGTAGVVEANYQLLKRGTYLMNQNASYQPVEIKPGVPLDLAEARNAIVLARLAGADRYAADTYDKAFGLLTQAEKAKGKNNIMMPARQAVQTAEDARLIALKRQEEELAAQQRAKLEADRLAAEQAQAEAVARARAEEDRRRQAELDAQNAAAARLAADRERAAAEAARSAAERDRAAAEAARASAEELRRQAEAQAQQAEAQAAQARASAAQAEQEKEALREKLRQQLSIILETRETARGLIVNLSDVLFDFNSANLKPETREKLARVAGILQAYPGLQIAIEGHTDNVGTDEYNQQLSERRAGSVRAYLVESGISEATVTALGLGESQPVATNASATGRQQNRRVELVVSGEPIGTDSVGTAGKN